MAEHRASRTVQRAYPRELKERAIRLVAETIAEQGGERHGAVGKVAAQLGIGPESLRHWVRRAEVDAGARPGVTTGDAARNKELEREVRELRRANEILKSAAVFFGWRSSRRNGAAGDCDPIRIPPPSVNFFSRPNGRGLCLSAAYPAV